MTKSSMIGSFRDFLPSNYTHLVVFDNLQKKKLTIPADLITGMIQVNEKTTVLLYYEGNRARLALTPFDLNQIIRIFELEDK